MTTHISTPILNKLYALNGSLTKTERKIAEVLFENPKEFTNSSLAELSQSLNVGEATFIRFCRTLGFKGFSDFKLQFSIELATSDTKDSKLLETDLLPTDTAKDIAQKLQRALDNVVEETVNLLDMQQIEAAVSAIRQADRIFLFGVGSSGITAEDAKNKFMRIGLQVDASANNHIMYMQAALTTEKDVVIGLSHSGSSKETVQTLKTAKKCGATTIGITHNLRSPLAQVSDFVLVNGNRQGKLQGDSISTKIAQLFVLDLIYTLIVQKEEEKAINTKQKTVDVILQQRIK